MEGQASRIHFNTLFGTEFIRHADDDTNAALNYGYAILHALVNRNVVLAGFVANIGIKHCSAQNPFNLSYDFMEPFRPLVDEIAYRFKDRPFDKDYRRDLVAVIHGEVRYGAKKHSVQDAVQAFVRDCLSSLRRDKVSIKEVRLP